MFFFGSVEIVKTNKTCYGNINKIITWISNNKRQNNQVWEQIQDVSVSDWALQNEQFKGLNLCDA